MSNEEKLEHLGEIACREQASRARDILRFVLKILCFISMIMLFILSIKLSLNFMIILFYVLFKYLCD